MFERDFADAVALLRAEHRRLEQLVAAWGATIDTRRRAALAREVAADFRLHMLIEQEIFYPAFAGSVAPRAGRDAAMALVRSLDGPGDPAAQDALVRRLAAELAHHVREEEEQPHGLFALCRASGRDLGALRDRMLERRDMLEADALRRARVPA